MICPACGYKDNEEGDHRCARCGQRLDRVSPSRFSETIPTPPPPPPVNTASVAPEWRQEVSDRIEKFRHKHGRRASASPEDSGSETVPGPDPQQKILAFEDFAAERIEPLIVEPPPSSSGYAAAAARRAPERRPIPPEVPLAPAPPEEVVAEELVQREILCPHPVAPLALRTLAGALDLAVILVAVGVFFGVFHLLGGSLHFNQKTGLAAALASGSLAAFYLFLYICYAGETPGMQWTGLRVLAYEGQTPHAGQRLVRALGALLSAAALGFGYLWAVADEEGLSWHDRMSKTFITRDPGARQYFRKRR